MAGRGPLPKASHQRERDTARRQAGAQVLQRDDVVRGPELPAYIVDPHPATVEWWQVWRTSPNAAIFEATDWEVLKRAALLQDATFKAAKPSAAAISELRLLEERLGATVADRQRLRLSIPSREEATGPHLAAVTPMKKKRDSLAERMKAQEVPEDEPEF